MKFAAFFVLSGLLSSSVLAAETNFKDVPDGTWYTPAVQALVDGGHIDGTKSTYRPQADATRAEFLKLVMHIGKIPTSTPPLLPSFDDVPKSAWYYGIFEDAAKEGLMRGDKNCYGSTPLTAGGSRPCRVFPEHSISRAEAAALFVRAFGLERDGTSAAGDFIDVGDSDWFAYAIYAAADHCILRGDPVNLRVRPHDPVNRAEMAVLFQRLKEIQAGKNVCPQQ